MFKKLPLLVSMVLFVPFSAVHAQQQASQKKPLDIYFLDTEGGQATLFVSPSGQSMLVDTGFPGNQGMPPAEANAPGVTRDADRIMAVLKTANISVLDYVVITHFHGDHVGNAAELAHRIPIRHFVDHGPYTVEMQPGRDAAFLSYLPVRELAHVSVAKPGDRIPVEGLDVQVVSSAGETIKEPMAGAPGAGAPNPLCRDAKLMEQDATPENFESVGIVVRYGSFRLVDLGDLTWNQEHALACPNNLVGTMTVFHTTRHGDPHSGAPQFMDAIRARVAVMNNGERKGGSPEYWQTVHEAPGARGFLADPPLGGGRRGPQFAGTVSGQYQRNRSRPLHQDVRASRRQLYDDQRAHRVHERLSRAQVAQGLFAVWFCRRNEWAGTNV